MKIKYITSLGILTSTLLYAQTPNIGDVLKEVVVPKEIKKHSDLIDISGVPKFKEALKDDKSGKKMFIKGFLINNNKNIKSEELQNLIKEFNNKELSFKEVLNIASIITREYRDRGYFVARSYIPKQDMKDNIVQIEVIEGTYGEFNLTNNSLVKDSIVQKFLNNTKIDGTVQIASIEKASLERTLFLINDLPGVVISKADVKPGKDLGTSDFTIEANKENIIGGYILGDNLGSRYTGVNRLMAGLNINSPLNIGDKLSLSGLISNNSNLTNGRISYNVPLMSNGLKAEMSYSQTDYKLAKEYKLLEALGTSKSIDIGLIYPIQRSRLENLNVSFNFSNNKLKDEIKSADDTTQKSTNIAKLEFDYNKSNIIFGIENQIKSIVSLSYGNLKFNDAIKELDDKNAANTAGDFSKIQFEISQIAYLVRNISLESSLKMQHSLGNKNLDGSEDFSIGGASGVKLYPNGEVSGENGYLFNIEAKYQLPNINSYSSKVGIFYDRGKAWMARNNIDFESKSLQDLGIGYYASYDNFFGQVQVAWNTNSKDIESEPNRNSRVLFQGGWSF